MKFCAGKSIGNGGHLTQPATGTDGVLGPGTRGVPHLVGVPGRRPRRSRTLCRWLGLVLATLALLGSGAAESGTAVAKSKSHSYKNCKALNRHYPHGVGRKGGRDKTSSGRRVTTFKVSDKLYAFNDGRGHRHPGEHDLDRDNDGIACEKH